MNLDKTIFLIGAVSFLKIKIFFLDKIAIIIIVSILVFALSQVICPPFKQIRAFTNGAAQM